MSHAWNRQLLLDIRPSQPPSLENFVVGGNVELLACLRTLAQPRSFDAVFLWGPAGCGRSHLLRATQAAAGLAQRRAVYFASEEVGADLACPPGSLLIVDDVEKLDQAAQIALFRAFNTARLAGLALLMSGTVPPRDLALREDLRTRIGSALVYEVQPLSEEDKAATLKARAMQRGMRLDDDLIGYLLRHAPRDLPSLLASLDALDRASLALRRPPTLPLLREVLREPGA
jgi:DnaA family protein